MFFFSLKKKKKKHTNNHGVMETIYASQLLLNMYEIRDWQHTQDMYKLTPDGSLLGEGRWTQSPPLPKKLGHFHLKWVFHFQLEHSVPAIENLGLGRWRRQNIRIWPAISLINTVNYRSCQWLLFFYLYLSLREWGWMEGLKHSFPHSGSVLKGSNSAGFADEVLQKIVVHFCKAWCLCYYSQMVDAKPEAELF